MEITYSYFKLTNIVITENGLEGYFNIKIAPDSTPVVVYGINMDELIRNFRAKAYEIING